MGCLVSIQHDGEPLKKEKKNEEQTNKQTEQKTTTNFILFFCVPGKLNSGIVGFTPLEDGERE